MKKFLLQEQVGSILVVRMNDPETHNGLSRFSQIDEFVDLAKQVREDESVHCIVLTGEGRSFCAGGNIKEMHNQTGMFGGGSAYNIRNVYRKGIQRIPLALYDIDVPVIAAMNGAAIGAGLDLACMCDVRIAVDRAIFAESFVKLGIIPGDGGAWLLPRIIGLPKATIMALTGDRIDAKQALAWDLITEITTEEELMDKAMVMAMRIASNPGHSTRMTKRLLREGQHMRLDSLLEIPAAYQAISHKTDDHIKAVSAVIEKRTPEFKNK